MPCPTGTRLLKINGSVADSVSWGETVLVDAPGNGFGAFNLLCSAAVRCRGGLLPIAALIVKWPSPPNQQLTIRIPDAVLGSILSCGAGGYELLIRWSLTDECALPLPGLAAAGTPATAPIIVSVLDPGNLTASPPRLPTSLLTAAQPVRIAGLNFGDQPGRVNLAGLNFPLEVVGPDPDGWQSTTIDAWMPAVGLYQCTSRTEALFREARFTVTTADSRTAAYPPSGLPGPVVFLPPPWIDPEKADAVRREGARLLIGDERRNERGNRLADHLTFRDAKDDFASSLYLIADGASLPAFAQPGLGTISSTSDLDSLVTTLLESWRATISGIPRELVVQGQVERWSDSFAIATIPGGDGVPAKAKWLFTTRAGVPSNVVDVRRLDIDLRLPQLITPLPPPRVVILFDQTEFGIGAGATQVKHPDLTPMIMVLVAVDPAIGAGLGPVFALAAKLNAARTQLAALFGLLGPLGTGLAGLVSPKILVSIATAGTPVNLDPFEFRAGGLFGIGRVSAEDIARSAIICGPPGSVVHLHNSRDGSNGEGTIVATVPSSGFVRIPALYRQNGTALPVSDPAGAITLLEGKEPPWPWTTFRDHASSVTFI